VNIPFESCGINYHTGRVRLIPYRYVAARSAKYSITHWRVGCDQQDPSWGSAVGCILRVRYCAEHYHNVQCQQGAHDFGNVVYGDDNDDDDGPRSLGMDERVASFKPHGQSA